MGSPLASLIGIGKVPSSRPGQSKQGIESRVQGPRVFANFGIGTRVMVIRWIAAALGGLAGVLASTDNGAAQAPVYAGKQIRMVIASGAGGGYDTYARFLARHMSKYIPGNPA